MVVQASGRCDTKNYLIRARKCNWVWDRKRRRERVGNL